MPKSDLPRNISTRFADLQPEDTVYRLPGGAVVKIKTVFVLTERGRSYVVSSPAICDPKTAKVLAHPATPGAHFILDPHQSEPDSHAPAARQRRKRASHAQALRLAAETLARLPAA